MNDLIKSIKKIWVSSKSAVLVFGAFMIGLGLYFLLRGKDVDPWEVLNEQKKSHKEEIKAIDDFHKEVKEKNDSIDKKLKSTLEEIDRKYTEKNKKLDRRTKKEVEKIVKDTNLSPEELAKKLADATGLSLDD
jgi:2-succinyl-5-enolpyruvyl-6-hydroxy-3-cyclohexene-1-carboxylate synthase